MPGIVRFLLVSEEGTGTGIPLLFADVRRIGDGWLVSEPQPVEW